MRNHEISTKNKFITYIALSIYDYFCYLPLTFIVLYTVTILVVLFADTSVEPVFIKSFSFLFNFKEGSARLGGQDVMRFFFFWWFILGTIFQVIKTLFRLDVKINKIVLVFLSIIPLFGTVVMIIKLGTSFIPIIFLLLYMADLVVLYALLHTRPRIEKLLPRLF